MSISLRKLRYLESSIRNGSITAAAREVNVSQSAISVAIKEIEDSLGVILIERTRKGVIPTEIGEQICLEIQHVNRHMTRIYNFSTDPVIPLSGHVSIGISSGALGVLPKAISEFKSLHPNITLSIKNLEWPELEVHLLNQSLDFAIAAETGSASSSLSVFSMKSCPRVIWASGLNQLSDKETIEISDLTDQLLFVYENDMVLPEMRTFMDGITAKDINVVKLRTPESLRLLVEANVGVGLLSDLSFDENQMGKKNVYKLPMATQPPTLVLGAYFLNEKITNEPAKLLFKHLVLNL